MDIARFARHLIESSEDASESMRLYADKMLMRIFSNPALLTYLRDIKVNESNIQMVFRRIPDESLNRLPLLSEFPVKTYLFKRGGFEYTGYQIDVDTNAISDE